MSLILLFGQAGCLNLVEFTWREYDTIFNSGLNCILKKQPASCPPAGSQVLWLNFSVLAVSVTVCPEIVHMTGDRLDPSLGRLGHRLSSHTEREG